VGAVLLDTTVLIDLLRGRSGAVARLGDRRRRGDLLCTTVVNVEEVVRGLRPAEVDRAGLLLSGLRLARLEGQDGMRAGTWRREHAERGVTLSQADCLIASAAVGLGATLATGNPKHFPMDGLVLEHWPAGA
jgi:predicted nucleic acid-binding protein